MATPFTSCINGCAKIQLGTGSSSQMAITSDGYALKYKDQDGVDRTCMAAGTELTSIACKGSTSTTNRVTIGNLNANSNGADILFELRGNAQHPDSNGGMKFFIDPSASDVYHFMLYAYDGTNTKTVADLTNISAAGLEPILFSGKLCEGQLSEEKFQAYIANAMAARSQKKVEPKPEPMDEDLTESQIDAIKKLRIKEERKTKK